MFGLLLSPPDPSDQPEDWFHDSHNNPEMGIFGLFLFLASLTMFFGASIIGYLIVRNNFESWPPPGMPSLPNTLWISTGLLALSSMTMQWSLNAIRRGEQTLLRNGMAFTLVLGFTFLVLQAYNWYEILEANMAVRSTIYGFVFFVLTGLHALHVIGGLVPIGVVTKRAYAGQYDGARHVGVRLCTIYWHFLGVIWAVLFAALFLI